MSKKFEFMQKIKKKLLFIKNQINIGIKTFYNRVLKFSGKFRHFQANFGYFLACFGYFLAENHVKIVTSLFFLFKISHVNFFHVISMRNFSTGAKYFLKCQKNLNEPMVRE